MPRDNDDSLLDRLCEIATPSTRRLNDDQRWELYKKMLRKLDEEGSSPDGEVFGVAAELIREIV